MASLWPRSKREMEPDVLGSRLWRRILHVVISEILTVEQASVCSASCCAKSADAQRVAAVRKCRSILGYRAVRPPELD